MTAEKGNTGKYDTAIDNILKSADCCSSAARAAFERQENTKRLQVIAVRTSGNELSDVLQAWADWLGV